MTIVEAGDETGPFYWNGSQSIPITATYKSIPDENHYVCKYGRATLWDCGWVGPDPIWSYNGWMYVVGSTSSDMSQPGDSGGPVAYGGTAYGMIHGKIGSGPTYAVFFAIKNLYAYTNLRLTLCSGCY